MTGYRSRRYAESLAEVGEPLALQASGGWVLRRRLPHAADVDAMGCYPLFACRDWRALRGDLDRLAGDVVALSLIADPFGDFDEPLLAATFPELCRPFKDHFVVDLARRPELPAHHRRNVRAAASRVSVERCEMPPRHAADWVALYRTLIARHDIRGIAAFSAETLVRQLDVPGLVMLRAVDASGTTAGMTLWIEQDDVAYYHLGAYSDAGYEAHASYALFDSALGFFADRVRWADLGAGAGVVANARDGLTRFKRGWSTGTRLAFLCGRVFDRAAYDRLVRVAGTSGSAYFPAYRAGEFA
jgi:hypothetical protein